MKKALKILLILTGVLLLLNSKDKLRQQILGRMAQAAGDLTIDWGVPVGQPVFYLLNFLPGEKAEKEISIVNNTAIVQPIGIRGIKTAEIGDLPTVLEFTISTNGTDLYGGTSGARTLWQFFNESAGPDAVFLFNLSPSESRKVKFSVKFLESAGNEFQGTSVVFDLVVGISSQIPDQCRYLRFDKIIYGTAGNDKLKGTNGLDLIFGLEGNDKIDGSNGNDCLVGGLGNDEINGSNGNDLIFGNEGNDVLKGSNGDDKIFGGEGNDRLEGNNGQDYLEGNNGEDILIGNNGNDTLLGGEGQDRATGGLGTDKCETEIKSGCEL